MNKIQLAALVSYLTNLTGRRFYDHDLEEIDRFAQAGVEPPKPTYADPIVVNELLAAMYHGRKIEAIKAYRQLTYVGLKEAKDAVERWYNPNETHPF